MIAIKINYQALFLLRESYETNNIPYCFNGCLRRYLPKKYHFYIADSTLNRYGDKELFLLMIPMLQNITILSKSLEILEGDKRKMNTNDYIVINSSDINLLQLSLRNYIQENPAVDIKGKESDVLRKLYSIQSSLNKSGNKELYVQKI